jgi:hypothetical protein
MSDTWQLSHSQQVQFCGFFRTYNLSLFSNFGQGLIRQSEFRTVAGGSTDYIGQVTKSFRCWQESTINGKPHVAMTLTATGSLIPRIPLITGHSLPSTEAT